MLLLWSHSLVLALRLRNLSNWFLPLFFSTWLNHLVLYEATMIQLKIQYWTGRKISVGGALILICCYPDGWSRTQPLQAQSSRNFQYSTLLLRNQYDSLESQTPWELPWAFYQCYCSHLPKSPPEVCHLPPMSHRGMFQQMLPKTHSLEEARETLAW